MPRVFQIFPIILISLFLAAIAWAQEGSRHISQKPEEIKEIIQGGSSGEKPLNELKDRPILEEKLKTPQEIMSNQQGQAAEYSVRSKKKRVSKVGAKSKKDAEGFPIRDDLPSQSSLAVGPRLGEPNKQSGSAGFIDDYYKSKPKIEEDNPKSKSIKEDNFLINQSQTIETSSKPSKHH